MHLARTPADFIDSAEPVCFPVSQDDSLGCLDAVRPIGPQSSVTAIVKKDDVAMSAIAINALARVMLDGIGGGSPPIEAGYIPHDRLESELARSAQYCRPPGAERRSKKSRRHSGDVGDYF